MVDDAAAVRFAGHAGAIPAMNHNVCEMFFQGKREGASDKARAENRYALNEVRGHEEESLQSKVES